MSKWINKDLFGKFQEEKKQEKDNVSDSTGVNRLEYLWKNPEKGTETVPKVYVGRFLPDRNNEFYKKYYYHMYKSGEKWNFFLCSKTHDMEEFCPICEAVRRLYMGSAADKKMAYSYKRKEKYVSNFYIVNDPRDPEREEADRVNGKVKLYEFPSKVEMKLKEQVTDAKYGLGHSIFDPGENGYDFIIKVLSTKKDPSGNVWPDYSNSEFSRKAYPLKPTEKEIDEIMETTINLKDYIGLMEKPDELIITSLKAEMLWDIVKDEWNRRKGSTANSKEAKSTEDDVVDDLNWEEPPTTNKVSQAVIANTSNDSDEELLKELENL
jgi:hypothetical protein